MDTFDSIDKKLLADASKRLAKTAMKADWLAELARGRGDQAREAEMVELAHDLRAAANEARSLSSRI